MAVRQSYLLAFDFDGTIANTSANPNGVCVIQAYDYAVKRVFGEEGLSLYRLLGGLKNRAPEQITWELLENRPDWAQEAMARIRAEIPSDLKSRHVETIISEMLVRNKLELLMQEIGPDWPLPCTGFMSMIEAIERLAGDAKLEIAIISSGHDDFINKVLGLHGIPCSLMVTDDEMRTRRYPTDPTKRVKPAPFGFNLLVRRWLAAGPGCNRSRVIYFGDDPNKDGGLAINVGVPFGLFNNGSVGRMDKYRFPTGSFEFSDWEEVAEFIDRRQDDFREGRPCSEIFGQFHT